MSEEQIFLNALELPDAAARTAYLDEACGGDAKLRQQVDELLASHFKSGEFMDVPAAAQIDSERTDSGSSASYAVTVQSVAMNIDQPADDESDSLEFLTPPTRPDSLGRIGHYEVLQVIGKGGFGTVLRAFDDVLQRVVAVKVMAPQLAATSPARKRFLREARTSAQVRHDNVVQVYEVGEQPLPYLVMEFIPGETLQQRLDRIGPLDVPEVLRIGRQIAEGLAAAHATDLIHRDIKPGNVLLEGGQLKVKITDFGLARAADDASMTQSGMIAGTPMYMAPEQVLGHTLDQRADLFSLGTVMYQMAAGRVPFRAPSSVAVLKRVAEDTPRNIREVIPETPQWLCDIIAKLHAKNPDNRYQSARDVADVLADCEEQLKQNSRLRDYSRIPRAANASRGSPWRKWVAVAAVVVFCSVIGLAQLEFAGITRLFRGRQPAEEEPATPGFTKLFNGKDLTGWEPNTNWTVLDNGVLSSMVLGRASNLVSSRRDFENFHLRVEARINAKANSGIYFRNPGTKWKQDFYEVQINDDWDPIRTGSLVGRGLEHAVKDNPIRPNEWFLLEISAIGNAITVKVNGNVTATWQDPNHTYTRGAFILQQIGPNTVVQFRKIEIKELPASLSVTDGFVALFNGKDLTGWKTHALSGGDWKVEDRAIDGRGSTSYLFSESGDYTNFHLRVEAKINGNGDAGVYVRTPFDVKGLPNTTSAKFALLGGYEAAIALRASYPTHTGSLMGADGSTLQAGPLLPHQPDEWFVLEVIAEDNQIRTLVDGKPVADYTDDNRRASRGHIVLQTWGSGITSVQFRRVEIKELPVSVSPSVGPSLAVAPFDATQAKQHQEAWAKHLELPVEAENKLGMKLILIPPAGAALANAYYLGKYEVTQEEWETVMGYNPSSFGTQNPAVAGISTSKFPVESVGWWDSVEFCNTLSEQEGLTPYYELTVTKRGGKDSKQITAADVKILGGNGYHIPRDVEWTHACAAGAKTKYHFGDKDEDLVEYAWIDANSDERSHRVGEKKPNAFGLYDMHGNVNEWNDRILTNAVIVNPRDAVNRGGAYRWTASQCEIRHWFAFDPKFALSWNSPSIGLRVARNPSGAASPEVKSPALVKQESLPPTFTSSIGMEFVIVPKGKSWLGGGEDELGEQEVEIPADFYLGKYEVTQEEWEKVMGENPSAFSRTGAGKDAVKDISDADLKRFPVVSVTWDQCQIFVAKLNNLEKESGWVYRLPKEAEWEYACRGGPMSDKRDSAFDFYFAKPTNSLLPEQANFNKGLNRTCKVGSYEPNCLGLFDLHGNVWEWCEDTEKAVVGVSPRVYLGGSYTDFLEDTRTALRRTKIGQSVVQSAQKTSHRFRNLGLRLARVPAGAPAPEVKTPPPTVAKQEPPPLAVAPFDAAQAKNHQDSWAKHLSVPVEYTNSIGMKFRLIPSGEFLMGASEGEIERLLTGATLSWQISRMKAEGPQQAMTVREPYYLGQHEVTLGQFRQFVQDTGYKTTAETNGKGGERHLVEPDRKIEVHPDYIWSNPIDSPTDDHPVVFVSLEDARQFCLWLSKKDGRSYALPRDDQWEFACRAGTTTRWFDETDVPRIAWVRENSEGRLHAIGLKAANPFGLCDMHGNAAELCEPVPPKKAARRGGDSTSSVVSCRSASRWELADSLPWNRNGFRVAIVGDLKLGAPATEVKTPPLAVAPFTDADAKRIAALPAAEQVEEVRKELIRRNPGFDGSMTHKIENGVVTELRVVTDQVTDIAPIRVFNSLRLLDLSGTATNYHGNSQLADLSPLKGMNLAGLTYLDLHWTQVGNAGLVHFQDCKNLWFLGLDSTQVTDAGLANFKDCTSLRYLSLSRTKVGDAGLAHFQDCKQLTHLRLGGTQVSDAGLACFKDCKSLRSLYVNSTLVSNAGLAPFEGCKELTMLHLQSTRVSDAGLAHFKDCKELTRLHIGLTKIADLSLLKEMPLKELDCDFRPERDAEILRSIKTLETINGKPAAEFWKEFD